MIKAKSGMRCFKSTFGYDGYASTFGDKVCQLTVEM